MRLRRKSSFVCVFLLTSLSSSNPNDQGKKMCYWILTVVYSPDSKVRFSRFRWRKFLPTVAQIPEEVDEL